MVWITAFGFALGLLGGGFLALVWFVIGAVGLVYDFEDLPLGWWISGFDLISLCRVSDLDVGCYGVWFSCLGCCMRCGADFCL